MASSRAMVSSQPMCLVPTFHVPVPCQASQPLFSLMPMPQSVEASTKIWWSTTGPRAMIGRETFGTESVASHHLRAIQMEGGAWNSVKVSPLKDAEKVERAGRMNQRDEPALVFGSDGTCAMELRDVEDHRLRARGRICDLRRKEGKVREFKKERACPGSSDWGVAVTGQAKRVVVVASAESAVCLAGLNGTDVSPPPDAESCGVVVKGGERTVVPEVTAPGADEADGGRGDAAIAVLKWGRGATAAAVYAAVSATVSADVDAPASPRGRDGTQARL
ncbi:hypothetical protein B0H17DRAFT_1144350 [Mycena rosella]|uniref:Uncharacterized protein n=1 Tax=Mycena rosella TaxID=1033263 RepID=A0AAD7CU48_MYCRO|nr:hypothetical protein B0H17DRAFT_1144350 [Mycena rosella]